MSELGKQEILQLDYGGKVRLLLQISQELLDLKVEYAQIAGRFAELRANIQVLKEVKSALQNVLRAENIS